MAIFLTPINTKNRAELAVANILEASLSDDYLIWHDVSVRSPKRKRDRCPDFVIFNASLGLWILEVKEWSLNYIHEHNPKEFIVGAEKEARANPYRQAQQQTFALKDLLRSSHMLKRNGRLIVPIIPCVAFYNISRQEFETPEKFHSYSAPGRLGNIPSDAVFCADELRDHKSIERRLTAMFDEDGLHLTQFSHEQVAAIRNLIFPDIQISSDTAAQPRNSTGTKLFDYAQETVLHQLKSGTHIIYGVAGSGKTLILLNKARQILEESETSQTNVLYLCRGTAVAAQIARQATQLGLPKDTICSFHKWCGKILEAHNIPLPKNRTQAPAQLISEIKQRGLRLTGYDAILVDEGHDFKDKPEWLELIASLRKSEASLFVVAYDEAQALYGKGKPSAINWDSLGVGDGVQRHILRRNYRNTEQILLLAKVLANSFLIDAEDQPIPRVRPIGCGQGGKLPRLKECSSLDEELEKVSEEIKAARQKGRTWGDIAVLFHTYDFNKLEAFSEKIETTLKDVGIPCSRDERELDRNLVKIMSFTKAKGLGFGMVNLIGVGESEFCEWTREQNEENRRENLAEDIRYLYNAITRALDDLVITYTAPSSNSLSQKRINQIASALSRVGGA